MSDHFLILIPTDPHYLPPSEKEQMAKDYLLSILPEADDIVCLRSDMVQFVDQGQNFERVICPVCSTELSVPDWQQMMDGAFRTQFEDLHVTMPCCSASSSLNDLRYELPAGFARFSLETRNPNADLEDVHVHEIEQMLGCTIRKIWRRV